MSLTRNSSNRAEKNARMRDIENEREGKFNSDDLQKVNEYSEKAAKQGMKLVPERRIKERSGFAQFLQENWAYLNQNKYLTSAEKIFLLDIMPYVGLRSNCIVDNPRAYSQMPLTQEEIGLKIGRYSSDVSKYLKSLEKKYIIFKGATGSHEYNSKSFAIYLNPNIIYSGSRDNVATHLFTMFPKPPKELKKLPIDLIPQMQKKKSKNTTKTKSAKKITKE
ncbi:MarR family transcriptional regulator [Pseudalkalibacillus hwajinpoensis]|uniref:MarR family transcriptional regulator n=1 Tax=Guptibacillus hwajinpoensis TaxID=208199 RepID=UPI00384D4677